MPAGRIRQKRTLENYHAWTPHEEKYLIDHYGREPVKAIASYLGRPAQSVYAKISSMRVVRVRMAPISPSNPWELNDEELNVLVAIAGGLSNRGIAKVMRVSVGAVEKLVEGITNRMVSPVEKQVRDFEPRCILVRRFLREGGPLLKRLH